MTESTHTDRTQSPEPGPDASRFEALVPSQERPGASAAGRVGSALALLALLVGLPVALVALGGRPPLPTSVPDFGDLARTLGPEDLVGVLVGIVWLIWLVFVACVVLEVIAARRGGMARTVPLAGPLQHVARALVGGLLVTGLVAGPANAAVATAADDLAPVSTPVAAAVAQPETPAAPTVADRVEQRIDGHLVYTVKAPKGGYHDNLWDIAEEHLGDGFRYKEIYELNKDRIQLDGRKLELARLIQPGWQLVMPDDAVGVVRVDVTPEPAAPAPPASSSLADQAASDAAAAATEAQESVTDAHRWWAGAGILAAGLLGVLAAARRRRPGRHPDDAALEVEADLRIAADPERSAVLDAVLRQLSFACDQCDVAVPAVYAVVLGHDEVELRLSPPVTAAVPGWQVIDDGAVWRFAGDLSTLQPPTGVAPAYPGLVSLGVDASGRDVLVDLAAAGGLVTVGGDHQVAGEVVSSIVLQTASSEWSRSMQVVAAGLPSGIAAVTDRVTAVDDLGATVDELTRERGESVLTGRVAGAEMTLVASGQTTDLATMQRLAALTGGGRSGLAVVGVGEHQAARWRLHVDEHGTLHVPQLDVSVTANRIGPHQVDAVAELVAAAGAAAADGDDRIAVSIPRRDADDAAWLTAPCRVGVLGPVIVDGSGDPQVARAAQLTELVTFLALHPDGVHPTVLAGAVWPLGVTPDVRDANIDRAREWLGRATDGSQRLRQSEDGRLSLGPDVIVDWDAFRHLLIASRRAGDSQAEADLLRRALKLVRGPAFDQAPRGRYGWTAVLDLPRSIGGVVVDAALRLAALASDGGDPAGAAAAAESGLRAYPAHQELWQVVLRSQHAIGGSAAVSSAVDALTAATGGRLDPATEALVDELLPQGRRQIS